MKKTSNINLADEVPIETYIEFQRWRAGRTNHDHNTAVDDVNTGVSSHSKQKGWPAYTGYSKDTMKKLLKDNPDYQHGPCKRHKENES